MKTKRFLAFSLFAVAVACGSRTALLSPEFLDVPDDDAAIGDATIEGRRRDVQTTDVIPPLDVNPRVDVDRRDCPDASATLVYVVGTDNKLYSFYPPDATFKVVGTLVCPAGSATPFSMAVDRKGVAYVLYNDGNLFRVSTLTAACAPTSFRANQQNFSLFGMGFSSDGAGPAESLYVVGDQRQGNVGGFGKITFPSLTLSRISDIDLEAAELTGTGDGRLYGFYTRTNETGTFVGEIDKTDGTIAAEAHLQNVPLGTGWAFGFWGGDFFLFTGEANRAGSQVTRYRPSNNSTSVVGRVNSLIVGAGVSTCAPEQ